MKGSLNFETAVLMVLVTEKLKVLGPRSEVTYLRGTTVFWESPIAGLIEALHGTIALRFSDADKNHFNPQHQTESEGDAKGATVTVASMKTEFIADLQEVGDPSSSSSQTGLQAPSGFVFLVEDEGRLGGRRDPWHSRGKNACHS